jgi:hypothetical protein
MFNGGIFHDLWDEYNMKKRFIVKAFDRWNTLCEEIFCQDLQSCKPNVLPRPRVSQKVSPF